MSELKVLLSKYLPEKEADILASILTAHRQMPIVIDGICGPTGKTTLCRELCRMGFHAAESWMPDEKESDRNGACVTITLNRFVR